MKILLLVAALCAAASACDSADGGLDPAKTSPEVGGGTADATSSQDATMFPADAGVDTEDDGSSDQVDAQQCVADPAWEGWVEDNCSEVNGTVVWQFNSATCTWTLGALPNADPPLMDGVPPSDLNWAREYFGCPTEE